MRSVFDANVLLSGYVAKTGTPGRLLRAWLDGAFDLVVSEAILAEVARTLEKSYFRRRLAAEERAENLALLRRRAKLVPTAEIVAGVATHPEDDLILATAISGQADYLVTGDRQLRKLDAFRDVTILTPREFLDLLVAQGLADES